MINNLKKKFIFVNMFLVFIVLLFIFFILYLSSCKQQKNQSLSELSRILRWHEKDQIKTHEVGKDFHNDFVRHPLLVVKVLGNGAPIIIFSDMLIINKTNLDEITSKVISSKTKEGILKEYNLRYMTKDENNSTQMAFLEISHEQSSMRMTMFINLTSMIVPLIAFFIISLFLANWVLKPLEKSWKQQQRFVADASHELKTPLTVILANNRIVKSKLSETISSQINWLENTEIEAIRINKLIENLLFLAKSEEANSFNIKTKINLSDLILSVCLSFEAVAFEKNVLLNTENLTPDIHIYGDFIQLKQLVSILIDNSIKYSFKKGIVSISLNIKQSKAILAVHNDGLFFSNKDKTHIFERFYQIDTSRSNGGYGLGLAIAHNIIKLNQGKIFVESNETNGTTFTISLHIEKF